MYTTFAVAALSGLALVNAQSPVAPTPTPITIIEGDPAYDGPVIPGTTGKYGNAHVVSDNPVGPVYKATLQNKGDMSVMGYVMATAGPNGYGIDFKVYFYDLPPSSEGPFLYHIHELPVPADGNCTQTMAHLDPYMRGEVPPCQSADPATCQVGDLSGKHGNITSNPFMASYDDPYVSDIPGNNASLVGKSIVVHTSNTTRLNCANFMLVSNGSASSTGSSSNGTTVSTPTMSSVMPFSTANGAVSNVVGTTAVLGGLMGVVFAFLL